MGRKEFVALIAMMFASIAFSIDSMLPALPEIGAELAPAALEKAPLILSAFLLGMGMGTFFTGPISDAFGRKRVILAGAGVYIIGALVGWMSQTLEVMLAARLVQGLGAAGPRVVALAVIRDRFEGRQMAKIASIVMMIFTLVPAVAPLLGAFIIDQVGWRGIFVAFIVFATIFSIWMAVRLPETLAVEDRRPLRFALMTSAVSQMFRHPVVRLSMFVQTLTMSMLFLTLMLVQPIYDLVYDRGDEFPYWFCVIALIAGTASLLNALLVGRFGMQRLVITALGIQILLSGGFLLFDLGAGPYGFICFVVWQTCMFFQAGLTIGNLNALAMEPMGHIAGMAASVIGAVATVGAAMISAPVGAVFGASPVVLVSGALGLAIAAFVLMVMMGRAARRLEAAQA
ncbi:MFS transporter [Sulfitobacter sp. S190]|nr:MFS transporter [Sulfitobacter sp. S190]UWR24163.1 MFS transporter [Sulfitobacter sp. S190]